MSVLDSIDTTVTLEWPGRRTIGSLVEVDGHVAVVTALNAPNSGVGLTVTVEGDTPEEAVSIDGVCIANGETAWGERRIEMELLRVGTVCSATRLREFVEQYGIASGGSVHIGTSSVHPGKKRFVYHVPEPEVGIRAVPDTTVVSALPLGHPVDPLGEADGRPQSIVSTAKNLGRPIAPTARTGETLPAGSAVLMADDIGLEIDDFAAGYADDGFDAEISVAATAEKTINSDLATGAFIASGNLDEAFREALRAVEPPRVVEEPQSRRRSDLVQSSPEMVMDAVPVDAEVGRPVLPDDDLEPTRMLQAMPDDEPEELPEEDFSATDLSADEVLRLKEAIDNAISFERELANSAHHDPDEPIIVNTVPRGVPFAEPVQLGNDNRAPTMAQVAPEAPAAPEPPPEPAKRSRNTTSTQRIERVAPALAASLKAPRSLEEDNPSNRKPSGSLRRIRNLFSVDMAIRCELPATFQVGKKKYDGALIRLAESRLRIQTEARAPNLYARIKVLLDPVDGGKNKITLQCEVTRVREPQEEGGPVAFDMRVSPGTTSAKDVNALRALIQSFHAPSSQPEASA